MSPEVTFRSSGVNDLASNSLSSIPISDSENETDAQLDALNATLIDLDANLTYDLSTQYTTDVYDLVDDAFSPVDALQVRIRFTESVDEFKFSAVTTSILVALTMATWFVITYRKYEAHNRAKASRKKPCKHIFIHKKERTLLRSLEASIRSTFNKSRSQRSKKTGTESSITKKKVIKNGLKKLPIEEAKNKPLIKNLIKKVKKVKNIHPGSTSNSKDTTGNHKNNRKLSRTSRSRLSPT